MDDEIADLRVAVAKLESQGARARWWNIAGGIASILGATVAALTLIAVLVNIGQP